MKKNFPLEISIASVLNPWHFGSRISYTFKPRNIHRNIKGERIWESEGEDGGGGCDGGTVGGKDPKERVWGVERVCEGGKMEG